jgi:hypothetical protein
MAQLHQAEQHRDWQFLPTQLKHLNLQQAQRFQLLLQPHQHPFPIYGQQVTNYE